MRISSVTMQGFRCFDESEQTVTLDSLTCFVGPNASGKTAAMIALGRLFGDSRGLRQIVPSDFHLKPNEALMGRAERTLKIECRLEFPELENGAEDIEIAIPETFNQMIVDTPGGTPYCRVRLEATWINDGTTDGSIEETLYWILTESNDPEEIESNSKKLQPWDRGRIRFIYIPAARDPEQQIRFTTNTIFGRLLDSLSWKGEDIALKTKLEEIRDMVSNLDGIQTMNEATQTAWSKMYGGRSAREVAFQALDPDPGQLLNMLVPVFNPGDDNRSVTTAGLSDGLRSLFSLSLSVGLYSVQETLRSNPAGAGFQEELVDRLPILTIFAIEEPENHLSPHYLGRIVSQLEDLAKRLGAQVILSSHSPSTLGRVEPDRVRYFLGHEHTSQSHVKEIPLPTDKTDEAFKYVREAVRGHPELYFSHLVILGEGPSEAIVLKRLLEASGTPLDTHFISIVPLGGRHVNHFWRLLGGLDIPYLTLLDLDKEKVGGGWGRIQYVRNQLVKLHGQDVDKLQVSFDETATQSLEEDEFETLKDFEETDIAKQNEWLHLFENVFDVFFSAPLDLDFSLLETFPEPYKLLAGDYGPRLPEPTDSHYDEVVRARMLQVLAANPEDTPETLGGTYSADKQELFPWYKYLFVDGSKPVAHMRALINIEDTELNQGAPATLSRLVDRAKQIVENQSEEDD